MGSDSAGRGTYVPLLLAAIAVALAQDSAPSRIEPFKPIAREIRNSETHSYGIHLERDQYLWLTEEQQGVDLSMAFDGPDGKTLAGNSQAPVKGVKEIFWITDSPGEYHVTLQTLPNQPAAGKYRLELRALRAPLPEDRTRVAAFSVTSQASGLIGKPSRTGDELKQAAAKYREALPLWQSLGQPRWESFVQHELGNTYLNLQQLPAAREALLAALPFRREIGDPRLLALTLSTLGAVYSDLGEYRQALQVLEEALPLRREAGDKKGEANTLNNLAFALVRLNDRTRAIDLHVQAMAIRREIDDKTGLTLALGNLAVLYRYMGQTEKALQMNVEELTVARTLGDERTQADALSSLGQSYYLLGEVKKAQEYWLQAEPMYQHTGDAFGLANAWGSLGASNAQLRKYKEAADYYTRALEIRRKASNAQGEMQSLLGLCYSMTGLGESARASEAGEQGLAIARRIELKQGIGKTLRCLGQLDLKLTRLDRARERLQESAAALRANGDSLELALSLATLGTVESEAGNLTAALAVIKEAEGLAETESAGLTGDLRASLRASRSAQYALEVDLLMRMHQAEPAGGFDAKALEAHERSRARSLIEAVSDSRIDLRQEMTAEQRGREQAILDRISSIQRETFREGVGAARKRELQQQLASSERELELYQIELRRTASSRYAATQYAGALGPDQIRRELLGAGDAVVEYAVGEKRSYVWALTPEGLTSATLPGREQIEQQVVQYRKELSQRASALTVTPALARIDTQSRQLYRMLWKPVERAVGGSQKVILVPDGALSYLPFETLTGEAPLIERFALGYAPSASALAALRKRAGQSADRARTLVAFADPVYDERPANPAEVERGFAFTRLPNTRSEATGIGALFPTADRKLYLGAEANERQVKTQDWRGFRFIHLAAHGYVDEEQPSRSGIILSPGSDAGDDGILQVPEIMRLQLDADLVTLSACQTGLGKVLAGEGVMGLTRAFLFAGARSVVVSLWNVNDAATAELMKAFYRNLKRGDSREEALRQAKLSLLRGPQKTWRHPYYWAPFVFVGDAKKSAK